MSRRLSIVGDGPDPQGPAIARGRYVAWLLIGFSLAAASLFIFHWLITDILKFQFESLDLSVRAAVLNISSPVITQFLIGVTKLGSTVFLTGIGSIACVIFIVFRGRRELVIFLVAMAGQIVLHHAAKAYFQRPRPEPFFDYPAGESYSFPSGHALASLCLYFVLGWLFACHLRSTLHRAVVMVMLSLLVLAIGSSRVYIGIHHLTDVIAGYLAALVWTAAVLSVDHGSIRKADEQ
jgi:undecaprenyl-diphosphatase